MGTDATAMSAIVMEAGYEGGAVPAVHILPKERTSSLMGPRFADRLSEGLVVQTNESMGSVEK